MTAAAILAANIGRYTAKTWDWDAFPANRGFAELERAQMRYIGAGGSPKTDDRSTLSPGAFTCSLIYQEPGHKASVHFHHIEELFFVHSGTLTMSWQFEDEIVDFTCGPGDAILNPAGRPHGFRNDGPGDCVLQIMVATAAPMLPTYVDHPGDAHAKTLRPATADHAAAYRAEIERWLYRADTLTRDGLAGPHFSFAVGSLARGAESPAFTRDVEEAYMVLDGVLDVEVLDDAGNAADRLRARDLVLLPAGTRRRLRNSDPATVRFAAIVGDRVTAPFAWAPPLATASR